MLPPGSVVCLRCTYNLFCSDSKVVGVQWAVSKATTATSGGDLVVPWMEAGTGSPAPGTIDDLLYSFAHGTGAEQTNLTPGWKNPRVFDVSVTSPLLVPGVPYYVLVRANSSWGGITVTASNAFVVDISPAQLTNSSVRPRFLQQGHPSVRFLVLGNFAAVVEWGRPVDAESGIETAWVRVSTPSRVLQNWTTVGDSLSVLSINTPTLIVDGTWLQWELRVVNRAGTQTTFTASGLKDVSPPVCTVLEFVLSPLGPQFLVPNPDGRTATATLLYSCADPESGVVSIIASLGTSPQSSNVMRAVLPVTAGPNQWNFTFEAQHGRTYFATLDVVNAHGIHSTGTYTLRGLAYFSRPPVTDGSRFHFGSVLGIPRLYTNSLFSAPFVLDHSFVEETVGVSLAAGSVSLTRRSRGASNSTELSRISYIGSPPSKCTFQGVRLLHGDVLQVTGLWANEGGISSNLSSAVCVVDLVLPVVSGFYGTAARGTQAFQSGDNAYFTVNKSMDADSGLAMLQARVEVLLQAPSTWERDCAKLSGLQVFPWVTLAASPNATVQEFGIPVGMAHGQVYRVGLRAVDRAGNVQEARLNCVRVDRTPVAVSFDAPSAIVDGGAARLVVDPGDSTGAGYLLRGGPLDTGPFDPNDNTASLTVRAAYVVSEDVAPVLRVSGWWYCLLVSLPPFSLACTSYELR
jgi:hypothetical protein